MRSAYNYNRLFSAQKGKTGLNIVGTYQVTKTLIISKIILLEIENTQPVGRLGQLIGPI